MPLGNAAYQAIILNRCQAILSEALGVAIVPALGTALTLPLAWLNFAVSDALADCRFPPADPSDPQDAECMLVPDQARAKMADCAEYHALSAALNQYLDVSAGFGNVSAASSDLGKRLQTAVTFKAQQIKDRYGVGVFQPVGGSIAVGQVPPFTPRAQVPPGQNWPNRGFGGGFGYGGRW